eukprot:scaffold1396_cov252-Pinguiococcus_pyrenoidosus.AAC.2
MNRRSVGHTYGEDWNPCVEAIPGRLMHAVGLRRFGAGGSAAGSRVRGGAPRRLRPIEQHDNSTSSASSGERTRAFICDRTCEAPASCDGQTSEPLEGGWRWMEVEGVAISSCLPHLLRQRHLHGSELPIRRGELHLRLPQGPPRHVRTSHGRRCSRSSRAVVLDLSREDYLGSRGNRLRRPNHPHDGVRAVVAAALHDAALCRHDRAVPRVLDAQRDLVKVQRISQRRVHDNLDADLQTGMGRGK